jgi:hypothetical protein
MEPDPVLVSNTREWLLRAEEDLANAQHDLMATPPFCQGRSVSPSASSREGDEGVPYVARLSLSENPEAPAPPLQRIATPIHG